MAPKLTLKAIELSTYVVTVTFNDENGTPVVPTSLNWTLTDRLGNVVNNRAGIPLIATSAEVEIVLTGSDLRVMPSGETRVLTVRATYDSAAGTSLALNDDVEFAVRNLLSIASLG